MQWILPIGVALGYMLIAAFMARPSTGKELSKATVNNKHYSAVETSDDAVYVFEDGNLFAVMSPDMARSLAETMAPAAVGNFAISWGIDPNRGA
jgi:sulfur transfer complex TusBCD TusB component (DsrH family)